MVIGLDCMVIAPKWTVFPFGAKGDLVALREHVIWSFGSLKRSEAVGGLRLMSPVRGPRIKTRYGFTARYRQS